MKAWGIVTPAPGHAPPVLPRLGHGAALLWIVHDEDQLLVMIAVDHFDVHSSFGRAPPEGMQPDGHHSIHCDRGLPQAPSCGSGATLQLLEARGRRMRGPPLRCRLTATRLAPLRGFRCAPSRVADWIVQMVTCRQPLSAEAALDRACVGGVECGVRNPGPLNTIRVAKTLDVSIS